MFLLFNIDTSEVGELFRMGCQVMLYIYAIHQETKMGYFPKEGMAMLLRDCPYWVPFVWIFFLGREPQHDQEMKQVHHEPRHSETGVLQRCNAATDLTVS